MLELRGYATIDAFLNTKDASLYVIDVNAAPPLLPGCPLFQQGLAESPPLYPDDFVRLQVLLALDALVEDEPPAPTEQEQADDFAYDAFPSSRYAAGDDGSVLGDAPDGGGELGGDPGGPPSQASITSLREAGGGRGAFGDDEDVLSGDDVDDAVQRGLDAGGWAPAPGDGDRDGPLPGGMKPDW